MATIDYLNPDNMAKPRGYSHAVAVGGKHRTIYLGGQNAIDEKGALVGKDSLREQTEQALANVEKILKAAGAGLENLVKLNIYLRQGQNPAEGFLAFQQWWGSRQQYPAITVVFVAGLGHPDWLVEIDGIAIVPEEG